MKKKYLLRILMGVVLAAGVLFSTESVKAASGNVKINSTNFPDAEFRKILKKEDYDKNQDGVLSEKEICNIISLDVPCCNISSLEGIEYLVNLGYLYCSGNNLSKLDVSKNLNLEDLDCSENNLSKLDVSKNLNLKDLDCSENNLSKLDVSKNLNLKSLDCFDDNLSKLDVSKNTKLYHLKCTGNNLSELDVSKNLNLEYLYCFDNNLSKLDVSKNLNLEKLYCYRNNLSKLDVSKNLNLEYLDCSENNLSKLDVSKNLIFLYCSENNLSKLDVSKNTKLYEFNCSENNLSKLDVSKNLNLKDLDCSENNLSKLDVSKNLNLENLYCSRNNLNKLDLKQMMFLENLYCSENKLVCLTLQCKEISNVSCDNNMRYVPVTSSNQFDLDILEGFDVKKAGNWKGGTIDGTILTFTSDKVTYKYDTGSYDWNNNKNKPIFSLVKCKHSGKTTRKTVKATFEKNGGVKTVCADCGKTIKVHETYYKMEQPKLSKTSYTYNGEVKKPSITIKDSKGTILKKDTDYTINYASGCKKPGKYKVEIKGKGKYSGTVVKTFTIKPPKSEITEISSPEKKVLKIRYKKSSAVTGYQIYCSTSKDFSKNTYKFSRKKDDENTIAISGLKSKKVYYVKIRTYKTVSDKKIYSSWSKVKSKKIK